VGAGKLAKTLTRVAGVGIGHHAGYTLGTISGEWC